VYVGPFVDPTGGEATESVAQVAVQTSGSLTNLKVLINNAPGAGNSWTITVRKNGASTSVTCTISNPNTSCTDTTHSVTFAASDSLSLLVAGASGPTAARMSWVANFS
jgi:hypothetical protein